MTRRPQPTYNPVAGTVLGNCSCDKGVTIRGLIWNSARIPLARLDACLSLAITLHLPCSKPNLVKLDS